MATVSLSIDKHMNKIYIFRGNLGRGLSFKHETRQRSSITRIIIIKTNVLLSYSIAIDDYKVY